VVFFPGVAPGWGMNVRGRASASTQPAAKGIISRFLDSTAASIDPTTPQPNGA